MVDMFRKIWVSATLLAVAAPIAMPAPLSAADHYYKGRHGYYHRHCKRSKGTTGLLAGAGGGGLGAAALGAGPVGIAAGVIGGGLLGRHIDKKHDAAQNRRNGC
jgi:hypothetical protein